MAPRLLTILTAKLAPVLLLLLVAVVSGQAESAATKAPPRGTGNPFDQLTGDWTGGGMVTPSRGGPEKVDCKVTYTTAGNTVTQTLLCTGVDNRYDAKTKFKIKGDKISGSWLETTFDASGSISGSAIGHLVHARISGDKFSGRMSINVSDSGHTINIVQLDNKSGAYRLAASFALHR
jgi:hypothetical protein